MKDYNHMFDQHWSLYQKILQHNYMGHMQIFDVLEADLDSTTTGPFSILDIGCGDAQTIVKRLRGKEVRCYTGIDLSAEALAFADTYTDTLNCEKNLINARFEDALLTLVKQENSKFDVIFSGFALHHLQEHERLEAFQYIYELLNDNGSFYLIDVFQRQDETRSTYLDRYLSNAKDNWHHLNEGEKAILISHVSSSDYPGTLLSLRQTGDAAGFRSSTCLLEDEDHNNILMVFRKT